MVTIYQRPGPALAPLVELLWYVDEPVPPGFERRLPTGGMQIVVNLGEDELRWYDGDRFDRCHTIGGAGLSGPIASPIGIDTAEQRQSVGIAFWPGGTAPFFPRADALTEPLIGLDELWGRPGSVLRERLLHAPTPAATLATLQRCLLEQTAGPLAAEPALGAAVAALEQGWAVRQVVDRTGTTSSSLGRMFRRLVGLSPKPYARVRRLQRVLTTVTGEVPSEHPALDWAGIANDHGYADQSHLINEFRTLAGTTPTAYRPRSLLEPNHVPVAG